MAFDLERLSMNTWSWGSMKYENKDITFTRNSKKEEAINVHDAVALIMLVVVMPGAYPADYPDLVVLNNEQSEGSRPIRVSRDDKYTATAPNKGYNKGRVGPVYTFVKTDPKANFKWGVRHRVGSQYAH
ncbi:hypothetical protein GHT06_015386 [Daphnia sinensis]|uniref:Uncharacterized protein n=1 Tax=Daphnia sinensis TaxID=1820382 RepID=A0AAD5PUL0_9CRUS|nr:hypothetical protein GHT06_015386 [Daphnia sinensis]